MELFDDIESLKRWAGAPCIAIFGSYRVENGSVAYEQGVELGRRLVRKGCAICSGGYAGIMEAVLRGGYEEGGRTIGVLTKYFDFLDLRPNRWVKAAIRANGLADRMQAFYQISDGFVVFEGSTGTLAEMALTLEFINKAMAPTKPLVCVGDFWKPALKIIGDNPRPFHPGEKVESLVTFVDKLDEVTELVVRD